MCDNEPSRIDKCNRESVGEGVADSELRKVLFLLANVILLPRYVKATYTIARSIFPCKLRRSMVGTL